MIDTESVLEHLDALQNCVDRLRPFQSLPLDELFREENYRDYWAIERGLILAGQAVVDISSHLVVGERWGRIKEYKEAILLLGRKDILPQPFAERLSGIAGLRNVLIHEYLVIDPVKVYEALQSLDDLESFIDHIYNFLEHKGYLDAET